MPTSLHPLIRMRAAPIGAGTPILALLIALAILGQTTHARAARNSISTDSKAETDPQVLSPREGIHLTLAPGTRVGRMHTVTVALGQKNTSSQAYSIQLYSGRIDVDIDPHRLPIYAVIIQAPRRVGAVAKGGKATVVASGDSVAVAARGGNDMIAGVGDHWRPLKPGRVLEVSARIPSGSQRDILPAPQARLAQPLAIEEIDGQETNRVQIEPMAEAIGYRILLSTMTDHGHKPMLTLNTDSASTDLPSLPPGQYAVRVMAVDGSGVDSLASDPLPLRVVGLSLPQGARLADGSVLLHPFQRVGLKYVDGLQLTYGKQNDIFISAPESVGLYNGHDVLVRLREPSTGAEARLSLQAMVLRAKIELSPHSARWPGGPVQVQIIVTRSDGTPVSDAANLEARVSINAQPLEVRWQRRDGKLTTEVNQPSEPGPWVLRVSLRDSTGQLLARDFLEISQNLPARASKARTNG